MYAFTVLLISILVMTAAVIGGIFLLYRLLTNFQPSQSKVAADLRLLKQELDNWSSELIPWKTEELELLSLNQTNRTVKKGITTIVKGMFTSIYHEPMVAYAYKKYVSSGKQNAILYARTSQQEFVYRIKNNEVQIDIDGELVGILKRGGLLYGARSGRLMARMNQNDKLDLLPIVVGDRELANLPQSTEEFTEVQTRAFQFLEDNRNNKEESVLLSLAVLELVRRDVPK